MKTNSLRSARSQFLLAFALPLVTVTLLAFAPQPARAGLGVPFHASFVTEFTSFLQSPQYLQLSVTGHGTASLMNACNAITDNQLVNLADGSATATYTLTGPHGDSLIVAMTFQTTNIDGGVMFSGSYTVIGGTGQFTDATGDGVLAGSALFLSENNGIGSFSLVGVIRSFGY